MDKILIPHKSWPCGMVEGIPVPECGEPVLVADMKLDQTYKLGRTPNGQRAVLNRGLYLSSPPRMGEGGVSLTFYESVR
jgi:hypothetical protein